MALTKKGTLLFGIGAGAVADPGISGLTATSVEGTSEFVVNSNAKNVEGEVAAHVFGSAKNTMRVEGFTTSTTVPVLGASVTVNGKTGAIMRSTITASNEDFVKVSVEGEGFANLTY